MENGQRMSFCHEGSKAGFPSCLLRNQARDRWEEVSHALGPTVMATMIWDDFMMRFQDEFAPTIGVKQLEREF